jgi:hypothetical protein
MEKKEKPVGPVVRALPTLHGKKTKLVREGKMINGVILSQDGQNSNDKLVFKWVNDKGTASISPLTGEELEKLLGG